MIRDFFDCIGSFNRGYRVNFGEEKIESISSVISINKIKNNEIVNR
jgi:hypothetical protein